MWQFGRVCRYQSISNSLSRNRFRFGHFLGTARRSAPDYIIEGGGAFCASRKFLAGAFISRKTTNRKGKTT
jgi:hypothetical protein